MIAKVQRLLRTRHMEPRCSVACSVRSFCLRFVANGDPFSVLLVLLRTVSMRYIGQTAATVEAYASFIPYSAVSALRWCSELELALAWVSGWVLLQ